MRKNARFSPALSTALLVATALTLPGCAKPEEKTTTGQAVTVVVTYNPETRKAEILDPNPDKAITLRQNKDWAVWYSPAGLVYVLFTGDSPFDDPPKHNKEKKVLKSGPARKKGNFPYVAKLVLTGDSEDKGIPVDPRIEVID